MSGQVPVLAHHIDAPEFSVTRFTMHFRLGLLNLRVVDVLLGGNPRDTSPVRISGRLNERLFQFGNGDHLLALGRVHGNSQIVGTLRVLDFRILHGDPADETRMRIEQR